MVGGASAACESVLVYRIPLNPLSLSLCLTGAYKPPSLGVTPSEGAKQSPYKAKRVRMPQFSCQFVVEARLAYARLINSRGDEIRVSVVDEHMSRVNHNLLRGFVAEFKTISDLGRQKRAHGPASLYEAISEGRLLTKELTVTALAARALDRFLFPDNESKLRGGCYHQLPSRARVTTPEAPDLMVIRLGDGYVPTTPILYADWKKSDFGTAEVQTSLYALTGMEKLEYPVIYLGLPCDTNEVALRVYMGYEGYVLEMDICSARREADKRLEALFCTLFGCVHYLIDAPIYPTSIEPYCCGGGEHPVLSQTYARPYSPSRCGHIYSPRVIHCSARNVVRKFYDRDPSFQGCLNIDANVRFIPGASSEHLNDRVTILQYPFLAGGHRPRSIGHIAAVILQLDELHSQDLVHSDMRKENIIFCSDGKSAHIIDFDLTARQGECYPGNYYHKNIPERHAEAQAHRLRAKVHDRWSLHVVLTTDAQMPLSTPHRECLKELKTTDLSLTTIAHNLLSLGDEVTTSHHCSQHQ